jgi:hypothetical protein
MTTHKDECWRDEDETDHFNLGGMSLRDWFAGQALAGGISGDNSKGYTVDEMAFDAYQIADAMLAARSK